MCRDNKLEGTVFLLYLLVETLFSSSICLFNKSTYYLMYIPPIHSKCHLKALYIDYFSLVYKHKIKSQQSHDHRRASGRKERFSLTEQKLEQNQVWGEGASHLSRLVEEREKREHKTFFGAQRQSLVISSNSDA